MHYVSLKKILTKFKTLSNKKYKQLDLENLKYCVNYILLKINHIILKKVWN